MAPQVILPQGVIQGEVRSYKGKKYYSFEGIPYAKPPLGKLRFRDPQPPEPWSGVRNCTKPGNKCAQINPASTKGFEGSEDCLYINVYTPSLPEEELQKLPVILFVHGGNITYGYGDYYQPDYFIRHHVVMVTFNYRLNILGFLSLDTPEVPGNAGLKDCAAALRWVRNNIQVFNGDIDNVTAFGESAGGAICSSFMCSKMAAGLFHKLIVQSGCNLGDVAICVQDHVGVARRVAETLDRRIEDKTELLEFLRSVPVDELVNGYITTKNHRILHPLLMCVIEKEFPGVESYYAEAPLVQFLTNRLPKVPILVGHNLYEGAAFVPRDKSGRILYLKDLKKLTPTYLYLKEDDPKREVIANGIKEHYFKGKAINDEVKLDYVKMVSDTFFNRDMKLFTELVAKYNSECYSYQFRYVGSMNIGIMKSLGLHGTTHGDPIHYQFYREKQASNATERDLIIVDFFSETFTNFAKCGKPTWSNQSIEWVPYNQQDKLTLIVDDTMSLEGFVDWECYKFWNELCGKRSKL